MKLTEENAAQLIAFLSSIGRSQENSEAWTHALFDLQESVTKIFEKLVPEALSAESAGRDKREVLWDIREEFRHIEYHMRDIDGR